MKTILTLLCLFFNEVIISTAKSSDFKLELVQVLFRHGDRISTRAEVYKNDPYIQHYEDLGYGVLTKVGMEREYRMGQVLRQRYNDFLGDYNDGEVYAYSTDNDRTKQSLQLVLAGLYPPSNRTAWNNDLMWIPIPTHYDQQKFNFLSANDACTTYRPMQRQVEEWPELKKMFEKYNDFAEEISNQTGEIYALPKIYKLYNNLRAALSMELPLPDWCTDQDYKKLEELAYLSYLVLTYTPLMTRIATGPTVEKFIENIEKSGKGLDDKEIYLYSGHEINIAQFCNAHNFTEVPKIPDYGCALIVEKLRGPDDTVYVRFGMWTGAGGEEFISINVKGCGYECPLSQYKTLVASILPDEESRSCFPTYQT